MGILSLKILVAVNPRGVMNIALLLVSLFGTAFAYFPDLTRVGEESEEITLDEEDRAAAVAEIEELIDGLTDQQLSDLQEILHGDLTPEKELELIISELTTMGMDDVDIKDLLELADLMTDYLKKVPDVERVVVGEEEYSIADNVKLYLLGLPNKLGPLGFVGLHRVLNENVEDESAMGPAAEEGSVQTVGDLMARVKAQTAKSAAGAA